MSFVDSDRSSGQSLVEVIIALAIFALVSTALASLAVGGFTGLEQGGEQTEAEALAQEGIEAVRSIRDRAWNENTFTQAKVQISGSQWQFGTEGSTETIGQYTRTITFANVCRDGSDDIAVCPATYTDVHTKQATVAVSWNPRTGITNSVQRVAYVTNWDGRDWAQTDWVGGTGQTTWSDATKYDTGTNIDHSTAGQLQLAAAADGTWALSGGTETTHTSDTDFDGGTFSSTEVVGTGTGAAIKLTQSTSWTEHADSNSTTTKDMNSLAAVSTSDIWAVGQTGTIIHYNGTSWSAVASPTSQELKGIAYITASDIWAVGKLGTIIHYNGTSWSTVTSPTSEELRAIAPVSSSDIWAVGKKGKILHYNGTSWSEDTDTGGEDWNAVTTISASDVWAVGKNGALAHYNGSSWSEPSSPTGNNLFGVDDVSATDIWAVGKLGTIIHYNGTSWSTVTSPTTQELKGIDMGSASVGWAIGKAGHIISYNGTSWSTVTSPTSEELRGVAMVTSTDGWAIGKKGRIMQYGNLYASSGTFESEIVDGGAGADWNTATWSETLPTGADLTVATRTGNTATPDASWSAFSAELTDATGSSISSGDARYLQYRLTLTRGTTATETPELADITIIYNAPTTADLKAIDVVSSTDAWAVGKLGTIIHYDGSSWSTVTSPTTQELKGIDMISSSDGWAVGKAGTIIHYDGSSWTTATSPTGEELRDVSMVDASDGWIVAKKGEILQYNGTSWSSATSPTGDDLNGVAMVTTSDGWAVGKSGTILQYNGSSWSTASSPTSNELKGIGMVSSSDGWAAGNTGTIIQYNGSSWSTVTSPTTQGLRGVAMVASDDGWIVAKGGELVRWLGSSWASFTSPTTKDLEGVGMASSQLGWAVGKTGTIIKFTRDKLYQASGTLQSSAFNMSDALPVQVIEWDETIPSCSPACTVRLQIQTAPDSGGSPGTWSPNWSGPEGEDGDATDFFTVAKGTLIHTDHNNDQWVRYLVTLDGDEQDTPVLTELRINYK